MVIYVKKVLFLFLMLLITTNVYAEENKREINIIKCENSENLFIDENGTYKRIKLLAYDKMDGSFNKEIDEYVCNLLTNAKKIEIQNDSQSDTYDKYHRELVWLYVDGTLLQKDLISKGYGQVNYVTSTYSNLSELCDAEKSAIKNKLKVWTYEGVKEAYCKSGITINNVEEKKEEEVDNNKRITNEDLLQLIFLNSGILLLILLLRVKK